MLSNCFTLLLVLVLAFMATLFPKEQLVQWAARKPWLRKVFNFQHVTLGAQTKFLKIDKLI